ncbi:MAG: DUF3857 domain-containing protein [Candidatus Zixiibacteriota bacterium]
MNKIINIQDGRSRLRSFAYLIPIFILYAYGYSIEDVTDEFKFAQSAAVIKTQETVYEIHDDLSATYTVTVVAEIRNKSADENSLILLYQDKFCSIKKFEGRVTAPNGKIVRRVKKKDGFKICGFSEYMLYVDHCKFWFDLRYQEYPYMIEFSYEIEYSTLFYWPPWTPQQVYPINHSEYTVIAPLNFAYSTNVIGDLPEPVIQENKNSKTIKYSITDVKMAIPEPYMYNEYAAMKRIEFSAHTYRLGKYQFSGGNWRDFSREIYNMMSESFVLDDAQKAKMKAIRAASSDDLEICKQLHESIRQNTRYVGIEIGIGNWQPTPSHETFERGYGDCKDLAMLYASMLSEAGIESHLAIVKTKDIGGINPDFPSLSANHVIFYSIINGDSVWFDPTCSYCEFGDLPWQDEDIYVLAIDSAAGALVKTDHSTAADNVFIRKAYVTLGRDRNVLTEYEFLGIGNVDQEFKSFVKNAEIEKAETYLQESDFGVGKKTRLNNIEVEKEPRACIRTKGVLVGAVQSVRKKRFISLDYFAPLRDRERIKTDARIFPLDLVYPMTYLDSIFIITPDSIASYEVSDDISYYRDSIGLIAVTYARKGNTVIITIYRTNERYFIPIEEMDEFESYIENVKKIYPSHFTFFIQ